MLSLSLATLTAQDWTVTSAPSEEWRSVASSADGTTLVAGANTYPNNYGPLVVSTNSGASWTEPIYNHGFLRTNWSAVACSADGTRMLAASYLIYGSTNSGATLAPIPRGCRSVPRWAPVARGPVIGSVRVPT